LGATVTAVVTVLREKKAVSTDRDAFLKLAASERVGDDPVEDEATDLETLQGYDDIIRDMCGKEG
jgi:hypothetical protein